MTRHNDRARHLAARLAAEQLMSTADHCPAPINHVEEEYLRRHPLAVTEYRLRKTLAARKAKAASDGSPKAASNKKINHLHNRPSRRRCQDEINGNS